MKNIARAGALLFVFFSNQANATRFKKGGLSPAFTLSTQMNSLETRLNRYAEKLGDARYQEIEAAMNQYQLAMIWLIERSDDGSELSTQEKMNIAVNLSVAKQSSQIYVQRMREYLGEGDGVGDFLKGVDTGASSLIETIEDKFSERF